ncbi:hypothetical protein [Vibrio sp. D431a]|uniref:hypothetical protein n=1 Tax=Vibrio sp. D431a TaxID=2837388 RepID=UPI002556A326|nr:hypothetical protein [Vibrio sp. D431a]MDK9790590.1 hypothetical protein [Vibrio sp. D431a]
MLSTLFVGVAAVVASMPLSASQVVIHGNESVLVATVDDETREVHYEPYDCKGLCNESIYIFKDSGSVTIKLPSSSNHMTLDEVYASILNGDLVEVELSTTQSVKTEDFVSLLEHNTELKKAFAELEGDVTITGNYNIAQRAVVVSVFSEKGSYTTTISLD